MYNSNLIKLIALIIFSFTSYCYGQVNSNYINPYLIKNEILQRAPNSSYPGSYKQLVKADKTVFSEKDSIVIDYFITGYGYLDFRSVKLFFSNSSSIIDREKSKVFVGFIEKNNELSYGGYEYHLDNQTTQMLNNHIKINNIITATLFNDFNGLTKAIPNAINSPNANTKLAYMPSIIFSEMELNSTIINKKQGCIRYVIYPKKNIEAGDYNFNFILTYFNGREWSNDSATIQVKKMAWYEKNESLIQWSALIIAIMTFTTLFRPCIIEVQKFKKYLRKLRRVKNK